MRTTDRLAAMIAFSFIITACGDVGQSGEPAATPGDSTHAAAPAAEATHACPMHPEVTGKKGDTCPKCGMDLEPVEVK